MILLVEPFHRMFSLDNIAIQFPHAEIERVPVSTRFLNSHFPPLTSHNERARTQKNPTQQTIARVTHILRVREIKKIGYMFIYAGVIPLLIYALWAVVFHPSSHQIHVTVLGFFISLILSSFLTDTIKNTVGRPRPDLIARCKPAEDTPEHALVTIEVCTETNHHVLHDGWRSFPSGHSSFAFSGLGYLALSVKKKPNLCTQIQSKSPQIPRRPTPRLPSPHRSCPRLTSPHAPHRRRSDRHLPLRRLPPRRLRRDHRISPRDLRRVFFLSEVLSQFTIRAVRESVSEPGGGVGENEWGW